MSMRLGWCQCLYTLQVPFEDRSAHMNTCGSRSIKCIQCGASLIRWQLKSHLETEHQLEIEGLLTEFYQPI